MKKAGYLRKEIQLLINCNVNCLSHLMLVPVFPLTIGKLQWLHFYIKYLSYIYGYIPYCVSDCEVQSQCTYDFSKAVQQVCEFDS